MVYETDDGAECAIADVNRLSHNTPFRAFFRLYQRVKRNFRHFTNSLRENIRATCRCRHSSIASTFFVVSQTPTASSAPPPRSPPAPVPTAPPPPPARHQIPPADEAPAPANGSDYSSRSRATVATRETDSLGLPAGCNDRGAVISSLRQHLHPHHILIRPHHLHKNIPRISFGKIISPPHQARAHMENSGLAVWE
jgi:hypothetical protein